MKTIRESYVPRCQRVGALDVDPHFDCFVDSIQQIPIYDDAGNIATTMVKKVQVSAHDDISKYRPEDFNLESMIENGVPLKMLSINPSQSSMIEQVSRYADNLDKLEAMYRLGEQQRSEMRQFMDENFVKPENVENNG